MIVEIVRFDLVPATDRPQLVELYRSSADGWVHNEDLIEKYYFCDQAAAQGGGVYIWKSHDAAKRWHDDAYRDRIRRTYGSAPRFATFDALVHVDTAARKVTVLS
jgi:hypothetical protein